jgi:hypothetical protein
MGPVLPIPNDHVGAGFVGPAGAAGYGDSEVEQLEIAQLEDAQASLGSGYSEGLQVVEVGQYKSAMGLSGLRIVALAEPAEQVGQSVAVALVVRIPAGVEEYYILRVVAAVAESQQWRLVLAHIGYNADSVAAVLVLGDIAAVPDHILGFPVKCHIDAAAAAVLLHIHPVSAVV